ncbi:type VI secretion system-associated protein TagF [Xanthomonas sp. NCPPB 1638]|uniref:type VI secretion system-associated protein TagF n=1 Tax=Xanthomonas TaxID=338 RepID=UPI00132E763F|nr:type VI secretion system-associated protein TagF [Xanthomonas cucurbitae]QHG85797.1 type VI secretion system-associated protein TagF [Xanthomonas cucurbitae]WDM77214.1 type VI secretion system-associated protein TagF [Xanthomonas cucurbitae]
MSMSATDQIGFYGKLPGVGDFVQRRLPPGFVQPWDAHLAACLEAVRQPLGERWPAAYRSSGVRAFALGPGVCGPQAWAGVLGPGEDRVGRCFPLTLAMPWAHACLPAPAWFGALAACLGRALRARTNAAGFETAVCALALPATPSTAPAPAPGHALWWRPGETAQSLHGLPAAERYLDWLLAEQDITEVTR